MKRILVPLDGSRLSEAVLPLAEALARDYDADLLLVRALPPGGSAEIEVEVQATAEDYLRTMAADLAARGRSVEWKVWYDEPARAIADAARYNGVDLIAMTTHGRGGVSRLIAGKRGRGPRAPGAGARPARPRGADLAARGAGPDPGAARRLGAVGGHPARGGGAGRALRPGHRAVPGGRADSRLTPPPSWRPATPRSSCAWRKPTPASISRSSPRRSRREGCASRRTSRWARRSTRSCDARARAAPALIAMTTHGRSGMGRLLLGSVAERVLRAAPVPVLLWKAPAESGAPELEERP